MLKILIREGVKSIIYLIVYIFGTLLVIFGITKVTVFVVPFFPEMIRNFYAVTSDAFLGVGGFIGLIVFAILFIALPFALVCGAFNYGFHCIWKVFKNE